MRVKSTRRSARKVLKMAKGYRMSRSKHFKAAQEAVLHAGQYAYHGRKLRKRDKRREWITQINSALTQISLETGKDKIAYSKLINALKQKNIDIDRKILATLTKEDFPTFTHVVETAMA